MRREIRLAISGHLSAMSDAQHEVGDDHQQRHKEERDRGARGEVAALNAQGKSQRRQGLRGVERPAGREDVDNGHVCEGKDEAEEHGNADNGPHHGNDDLELRAPEAGAIHRGRLRNVLGNSSAAGEQYNRGKWHQAPTVDQKDGSDGETRLAEPHRGAERLVDVYGHKDPGDHAVDRIEDPFPPDGAERDGSNPRQKNQKTDDAAATKGLFQEYGENVGADDHHDLGADGEDKGIADGNAKTGALQDAAEVFQANEMHFGVAVARIAESIKDSEKKGTADEQQDV